MSTYPAHHHVYQQRHLRCPICGQVGVAAAMIEDGKPITRRDIRRPRWKRFKR